MAKKTLVKLRDDQHKELAQYRVDSNQTIDESIRQGVDLFLDKIKKKVKKKGEL